MNKLMKIMLAILGAFNVVFNVASPLLLCVLWVNAFPTNQLGSILFYTIGITSTVFRSFKFWINQDE